MASAVSAAAAPNGAGSSSGGRLWSLMALVAVAGALLWAGPVRGLPERPVASALPWLLLAAGFALSELAQVHMHFGQAAHILTFTEIPLVLSLFAVDGSSLVLAHVVGTGVARLLILRQPAVKAAFNLALAVLDASLAVLVFSWVTRWTGADAASAASPVTWLAALTAVLVPAVVSTFGVATAIVISEPAARWRDRGAPSMLAAAVSAVNAAIGLTAAAALESSPAAMALLAGPVVMLWFGYAAYARQLSERRRVDLLLACSRALHEGPGYDERLATVLALAREALRARAIRLVLLPDPGGASSAPLVVGAGDLPEEGTEDLLLLARRLAGGGARLVTSAQLVATNKATPGTGEEVAHALQSLHVRQLLVAPLRGAAGPRGALLAMDAGAGSATRLPVADLGLLDALAELVSSTLEREGLVGALHRLRDLQDQLVHQATHDSLTGLSNRRHLMERLEHALQRRAESGLSPAVLYLDLDGLKSVNDRFGHAAGDQLLAAVADRIRSCLRPSDTAARIGGDEFVIALDDAVSGPAARDVAQRLLTAVTAPLEIAGQVLPVGASLGLSLATPAVRTAEELLEHADEAMYDAKATRLGAGDTHPERHAHLMRRQGLSSSLTSALAHQELTVAYQPIVSVGTGLVEIAEALVRWPRSGHGEVLPAVLLPIAADTGQLSELGRLVLGLACRQLATWQRTVGPAGLAVAVNVSRREVVDSGFVAAVTASLEAAGADPRRLVLELRETDLIGEDADVVRRLHRLREMGVRVAIDNFGAGYASLRQLRQLPADLLKIDGSLVANATGSPEEEEVVRTIVRLGEALRLQVVAEGVETQQQHRLVTGLGVRLAQGFYYGPPVTAAELTTRLAQDAPAAGDQDSLRP